MPSQDWQEYPFVIFRVFGGCCGNAFSLEALLTDNPGLGSALTFSQLLFIAAQSLPSFLRLAPWPRLKPRNVPIRLWIMQVILLTSVSLLNNWAFQFRVPLALLILIRSAGLVVAMCIGYLFLNKKYTSTQVTAVIIVSVGVVLATLSRPTPPRTPFVVDSDVPTLGDPSTALYIIGVSMLAFSLVLSGILGALQERTFAEYGPHWQEGVFYTHALSIPIFAFLLPEVKRGLRDSLVSPSPGVLKMSGRGTFFILLLNLTTQSICVKSVNKLTTRMSSVSANLILTARKALSLCLSVWWFGDGWNMGMTIGAALVFLGSIMYAFDGKGMAKQEVNGMARDAKNK